MNNNIIERNDMTSSKVEYQMGRDEIISNLQRFDEEARILLEKYSTKPKVVIMGGSAFILMEHLERMTFDIDWELLEHLVHDKDEAQDSNATGNRYKQMVENYEQYKKEFRT